MPNKVVPLPAADPLDMPAAEWLGRVVTLPDGRQKVYGELNLEELQSFVAAEQAELAMQTKMMALLKASTGVEILEALDLHLDDGEGGFTPLSKPEIVATAQFMEWLVVARKVVPADSIGAAAYLFIHDHDWPDIEPTVEYTSSYSDEVEHVTLDWSVAEWRRMGELDIEP
jgi:hypothetical protein